MRRGYIGRHIDVKYFERVVIEYRPNAQLLAVTVDIHFVDGHFLSLPTVGLQ